MATLDATANEIVIRVVYDGPPEAGKTTSMRALASSLAQSTVTPEEDANGRTLWFDWMEYVGGMFEGCRIRCQIVSVPGQQELRRRRKLLLDTADVVVFVADSTPERWDLSLDYLLDLQRMVDGNAPPIGVIVQANKRDTPGAIDLDNLRLRLGDARWSVGVVESVAADGTGIREAFVYAVRLALDRVRELVTQQRLPHGSPELTSPEQLLAQMQGVDHRRPLAPRTPRVTSTNDSVAAALLREVIGAETAAPTLAPSPTGAPRPPDASVPSGAIWPPVEGRAILQEVAQLELVTRKLGNGDWSAGLGTGWRIVSCRESSYDTLDAGRSALIQWARLHAACQTAVSPRRCIVLAAGGDGTWRLWQIVRAESSLREFVGGANAEPTLELVVHRLCQAAQLLVDVHERLSTINCELPTSLDTVGQSENGGAYIGLMPLPAPTPPKSPRLDPVVLLSSELGPMLDLELAERRSDLGRALDRIPRLFTHSDTVFRCLSTLLV